MDVSADLGRARRNGDDLEELDWEPIRLRASSVAAFAGIHPFAELDELIVELVYQGSPGEAAFATDVAVLGAEVESREAAVSRTLSKTSVTTAEAIAGAIRAAGQASTTGAVRAAVARAEQAVDGGTRRSELNAAEARDLKAFLTGLARTDFGRRVESVGLVRYEQETGSAVSRSNDCLLLWNFPGDEAEVVFPSTLPPEHTTVAELGCAPSDALFYVAGKVDGIAQEADCRSADPNEWTCKPVVVEVKSRVSRLKDPPELYDQLQLVVYSYMTGCNSGDLVQLERAAPDRARLVVSRVDRAEHDNDFRTIVLPRLYRLVRAVDALRREPDRRRALLAASPRQRWQMAVDLCDWLPDPPSDYVGAFYDPQRSQAATAKPSKESHCKDGQLLQSTVANIVAAAADAQGNMQCSNESEVSVKTPTTSPMRSRPHTVDGYFSRCTPDSAQPAKSPPFSTTNGGQDGRVRQRSRRRHTIDAYFPSTKRRI